MCLCVSWDTFAFYCAAAHTVVTSWLLSSTVSMCVLCCSTLTFTTTVSRSTYSTTRPRQCIAFYIIFLMHFMCISVYFCFLLCLHTFLPYFIFIIMRLASCIYIANNFYYIGKSCVCLMSMYAIIYITIIMWTLFYLWLLVFIVTYPIRFCVKIYNLFEIQQNTR